MVFIEAPVGVGFSYSDNEDDYQTGDLQTAADNYALIQAFLDRFPHLRNNDLHLSSESYGGHYIPTLAKHIILENNKNVGSDRWLNLKGFAVGNPYTDPYSGLPAMIETFWGHQIISREAYSTFQEDCNGVDVYSRTLFGENKGPSRKKCYAAVNKVFDESGSLNPYALDYRICSRSEVSSSALKQRFVLLNTFLEEDNRAHLQRRLNINEYVPCTSDYANAYLNQAGVKAALHVKSDIQWYECSDPVWKGYNKTDSRTISTAPIYKFLIESNHSLNILVYSGDDDAVCGTIGTQKWIWNLGYPNTKNMWSEYVYDEQLAGYYTTWKDIDLTFLTIHNAGHEVNLTVVSSF